MVETEQAPCKALSPVRHRGAPGVNTVGGSESGGNRSGNNLKGYQEFPCFDFSAVRVCGEAELSATAYSGQSNSGRRAFT